MKNILARLKQSKGATLIETAVVSLFFVTFVIFATNASLMVFETSRDGRSIAAATDMVRQIYKEGATPSTSDFDFVLASLRGANYIKSSEAHRLIVSGFEYDGSSDHVRFDYFAVGSNTDSTSRIQTHNDASMTPGVEIRGHFYQLSAGEKLYVVEMFTGDRGRTNVTSGELPFYEFGVFFIKP